MQAVCQLQKKQDKKRKLLYIRWLNFYQNKKSQNCLMIALFCISNKSIFLLHNKTLPHSATICHAAAKT